jgi:hypothetical protein
VVYDYYLLNYVPVINDTSRLEEFLQLRHSSERFYIWRIKTDRDSLMSQDLLKPSIDGSAETLRDVNSIKELESKLLDGSDNQYGLVKVLEMLDTSYNTIIKSLKDFMGLSFGTEDDRKQAKGILLDGKMGITEAQLKGARSRCRIIERIYHDFLRDWFNSKKLEAEQSKALNALFQDKLAHDDFFVLEMESVGDALRNASADVYPLFIGGDFAQASRKVEEFSQKVDPSLNKLSDEWKKLASLEADFRENLK